MSLEQVDAFYENLTINQEIYEQYYKNCSIKGTFGVWNWDKKKIVNFAATLGYEFSEPELDEVLFDTGALVSNKSLNLR
ncbi:Nif11-like leader peptide family natural product precursor [Rivularia sp. UHCC 0363]|uniref:Nif11-like leader peptide family natural product precursor n=1 Tax=Rivularia sp. UHCC 0363 TaxID=3110244 RepID=UPI002B1FA398|nr:Nif11-like leader peptide family natural product precursor [Rivularia sp. UHCC 0363]MEA5597684.1 Nif11-like leader peptide family natural product precursor [Rivularia sp. UHCC 0363]